MGDAVGGILGLVAAALLVLLLIADWGSDRANAAVRRLRRLAVALLVVLIFAFIYTIARYGLPVI